MTTLTPEQRARNLLQNYPDMFPIDPFQIARDLGIEIRYLSNSGLDVSGRFLERMQIHPLSWV